MTERTETAIRYFTRLFAERDLTACDELLAPDYIDHDAPPDTRPGPDATRQYVTEMLAAYPDLVVTIESTVELSDHVALNLTWEATGPDRTPWRQTGLILLQVSDAGQILSRNSTYTS